MLWDALQVFAVLWVSSGIFSVWALECSSGNFVFADKPVGVSRQVEYHLALQSCLHCGVREGMGK